jgi:hypothetical protein
MVQSMGELSGSEQLLVVTGVGGIQLDSIFLMNLLMCVSPVLYLPSLAAPSLPPSVPLFLLLTHSLRVMNNHLLEPLNWSIYWQSVVSVPLHALLYYRSYSRNKQAGGREGSGVVLESFFVHLLIAITVLTVPIDLLFLTKGSSPLLSISCALESAVPVLQLIIPIRDPQYGSVSFMVAASWLLGDVAKLFMCVSARERPIVLRAERAPAGGASARERLRAERAPPKPVEPCHSNLAGHQRERARVWGAGCRRVRRPARAKRAAPHRL